MRLPISRRWRWLMPTDVILAAAISRRYACRCRRSPIPPSMAMPSRSGDLSARPRRRRFRWMGRIQAGGSLPASAAQAAGHAVRIFTGAPMPAGRRYGVHAGRRDARSPYRASVVLPPGIEGLAPMCALCRRRYCQVGHGGVAVPAGGCGVQDIALAAALGLAQVDVRQADSRGGVFNRQRIGVAGRGACGDTQLFDSATASC